MAGAEYVLQTCSDAASWDALVAASAQGTIFSDSRFLQSLGCRYQLWQVIAPTSGQVLAQFVAIEQGAQAGEKPDLIQFAFTPYQGLLFLPPAHFLPRQRLLDEFRLTEFILQTLPQHYRNISMSLSWELQDVRPFLWHHFHQPELGQFTMQPRYTALLQLQNISEEELKMQARACRRQEMKKAAQYALSFEGDIEEFLRLYALTFARQEISLNGETLALVENITRAALAGGYGKLSACSTAQGVAAMNLFVYDNKRAYYLFAANDPAQRNSGAASRLMFANIFAAKQMGMAELDFVGVNSPNRGDFKLSFNPELKLYFDAHLRQPA